MIGSVTSSLLSLITLLVLTTNTFAATITLPRSGQTACYDASGVTIACAGTGQDGDNLNGAAWPSPRFVDNGNGTISDKLTGLVWLKNANCYGLQIWSDSVTYASNLANGTCGLTDGSVAGQWRLPNRNELISLVDRSTFNPALPAAHPFTSVQLDRYWSSSDYSPQKWYVSFVDGGDGYNLVTTGHYVWPVRY